MRKRKWIPWVCLILVTGLVAIGIFWKPNRPQEEKREPDQKTVEPTKTLTEDFMITEPEALNLEEYEDKTPEEKEEIVKERKEQTKIEPKITEQEQTPTQKGVQEAYKWVSSFDSNAKTYKYGVSGYDVNIGDWQFVLDSDGTIREYLYTTEPKESTLEALETVYPWGEMVKTNTGYKWLKPSEVCSRNTVGWDYDKKGIAEGCPTP